MEQTISRDDANKALKLRDSVIKLFKNREYKSVFEEGYFKAEAMRLPLALCDDEMQDEVEQRILNEKVKSIGHLHVYLNSVIALGNQVEQSLKAEEEERERANKEMVTDEITGEEYEVEDI